MIYLKRIGIGLLALLFIVGLLWLDAYLPYVRTMTITGTEVKRMDVDGPISAENPEDGPSRDVYFIFGTSDDGSTLVVRNEDTGWSWPPYLKFDSADIQAIAHKAGEDNKRMAVTTYGWRVKILSWFPNTVKLQPLAADESCSNWTRTSGFTLYLLLWIYLTLRMFRKLKVKSGQKHKESPTHHG